MKAIIFSYWFEAPDELYEFCQSIGYDEFIDYHDFDLMFDERVINFCEQRLSSFLDEQVYKGRPNTKFRVGFAGAGYIRDIDVTKTWMFDYNRGVAPVIKYIDLYINKYGYLSIKNSD